jgi:hypothetical protein
MNDFQSILSNNNIIPVLIFVIGGLIAIVSIVFSMGKSITVTKERERTRRELSAYVAEGSMTPEDAERLLKASPTEEA